MSQVKYTEEGQERRKKQLKDLRERMAKLKRLESYRESGEWKDLRAIIDGFIASEENAAKLGVMACANGGWFDPKENGLKPVEDHKLVSDLRVAVERKAAFQLIIDMIEKTEDQIASLDGVINRIEESFKEANGQLA